MENMPIETTNSASATAAETGDVPITTQDRPITCTQGHHIVAGDRFCRQCGEPVSYRCPNGHEFDADERFCPLCTMGGSPSIQSPRSEMSSSAIGTVPSERAHHAVDEKLSQVCSRRNTMTTTETPIRNPQSGPQPGNGHDVEAAWAATASQAPRKSHRKLYAIVAGSVAGLVGIGAVFALSQGSKGTSKVQALPVARHPVPASSQPAPIAVPAPTTFDVSTMPIAQYAQLSGANQQHVAELALQGLPVDDTSTNVNAMQQALLSPSGYNSPSMGITIKTLQDLAKQAIDQCQVNSTVGPYAEDGGTCLAGPNPYTSNLRAALTHYTPMSGDICSQQSCQPATGDAYNDHTEPATFTGAQWAAESPLARRNVVLTLLINHGWSVTDNNVAYLTKALQANLGVQVDQATDTAFNSGHGGIMTCAVDTHPDQPCQVDSQQ
jgi:hypothetical protein